MNGARIRQCIPALYLSVLVLLLPAAALATPPEQLLHRAEERMQAADFEGALEDCSETVRLLKTRHPDNVANPKLANAYLLMANVLLAQGKDAQALKALQNGLGRDPSFPPDSPLLAHPVLKPAAERLVGGACAAFREAQTLATNGDPCRAVEVLNPVLQQGLCPVLSAVGDASLQQFKEDCRLQYAGEGRTPLTCTPGNRLAVFPLILSDPRGDGAGLVTNQMILEKLGALLPDIQVNLLDTGYVKTTTRELGITEYRSFMAESVLDIYVNADNIKDADVEAGGICAPYQKALIRFFKDACSSNIVFVLLENKGYEGEREIYIRMCLYNSAKPYAPTAKDWSRKFSDPRSVPYELRKRLAEVQDYLEKQNTP